MKLIKKETFNLIVQEFFYNYLSQIGALKTFSKATLMSYVYLWYGSNLEDLI